MQERFCAAVLQAEVTSGALSFDQAQQKLTLARVTLRVLGAREQRARDLNRQGEAQQYRTAAMNLRREIDQAAQWLMADQAHG